MKYILLSYCSFLVIAFSMAQTTFYRSLDLNGDITWGMQVNSLPDGYMIVGLENCNGKGCVNWLETDLQGIVRDRFYLTDTLQSITGTNRGSYLKLENQHFITATISQPDGTADMLISEIDPTEQTINWIRVYGSNLENIPTKLIADDNHNIFAYYSKLFSTSPFISTTNLLKINISGDTIWETVIGIEDDYNNAFNHLHLPSGDHLTFYAACEPGVECQSFLTGYGLYSTKVDSLGNELWSQELRRGHYTRWNGTD
ncbi:MAG: hypothetical protein AAFO03_16565, partial [Bacteroidota bacterium]